MQSLVTVRCRRLLDAAAVSVKSTGKEGTGRGKGGEGRETKRGEAGGRQAAGTCPTQLMHGYVLLRTCGTPQTRCFIEVVQGMLQVMGPRSTHLLS